MIWENSALTSIEMETNSTFTDMVTDMGVLYDEEFLGASTANYLAQNMQRISELNILPGRVAEALGPELSSELEGPMATALGIYGFDVVIQGSYSNAGARIRELSGNFEDKLEDSGEDFEEIGKAGIGLVNYWSSHLLNRGKMFSILAAIKNGTEAQDLDASEYLLNFAEGLTLPLEHYFIGAENASAEGFVPEDLEKIPSHVDRSVYLGVVLERAEKATHPYVIWQLGNMVRRYSQTGKMPFELAVSSGLEHMSFVGKMAAEVEGEDVEEVIDNAMNLLDRKIYENAKKSDLWNAFERAYTAVASADDVTRENVESRMKIAMGERKFVTAMQGYTPLILEKFINGMGDIQLQDDGSPQTLESALGVDRIDKPLIITPGRTTPSGIIIPGR